MAFADAYGAGLEYVNEPFMKKTLEGGVCGRDYLVDIDVKLREEYGKKY